jgi:signal transduction histidine kinase
VIADERTKREERPQAAGGRPRVPIAALAGLVGVALAALVWLDHIATRRELMDLLRAQAAALTETIAAAARANDAAARQAQEQLAARLLDNARLIRDLDRLGQLDDARLQEIAARHGLFRVNVFDATGTVERGGAGIAPHGAGHGPGLGQGRGFRGGRGPGAGSGAGPEARRRGEGPRLLLDRLLGGEEEATSDVHQARFGQGARLAAGVRRSGGGAIILNVDASAVVALERQATLGALLADIVSSAPGVAYVAFDHAGESVARGDPPPATSAVGTASGERQITVQGRPVIEFARSLALAPNDTSQASLRVALRLDGVRQAERRMAVLVILSILVSLALAGLGVGTTWLRRRYALLSAEHARAQEALRRRDRLAAMGELAASVAHEIRNPLNAIGMSAQRLRREVLEPALAPSSAERGDADELLRVVENETRRINRTVQQFLDFARPPKLALRAAPLAALVTEAGGAIAAFAADRGVVLEVETTRAAEATVDADQLRQALDNLLRNAVEATEKGGTVRLTAESAAREHSIIVADTGAGISQDVLPRIFDLYFTTKANGTGVGLAVTQQIVTAHGGTLEVESSPGAGTTMTVRLPASEESGRA